VNDDIVTALREHWPHVDPAFSSDLEERLLPSSRSRSESRRRRRAPGPRRVRTRPVLAGLATAGALSFALLVASVLGGGPLGSGASHDARARDDCRTVVIVRAARVPRIELDARGEPRVVYSLGEVRRRVTRCG
jgi:hypothetical protein